MVPSKKGVCRGNTNLVVGAPTEHRQTHQQFNKRILILKAWRAAELLNKGATFYRNFENQWGICLKMVHTKTLSSRTQSVRITITPAGGKADLDGALCQLRRIVRTGAKA